MATAVEIGSLIDRDPSIRGGRPKIAGTGVSAGGYRQAATPEDIAREYGHLSLAQVHAALAYYHANSKEIEADLAAETALEQRSARASTEAMRIISDTQLQWHAPR